MIHGDAVWSAANPEPKRGEVVVRIKAAAMNRVINGCVMVGKDSMLPLPHILGSMARALSNRLATT